MKKEIIKRIVLVGMCACAVMARAEGSVPMQGSGITFTGGNINMNEIEPRTEDEVRELQRRAEAGEAEAQHELSICYGRANGIGLDYAEAFKWAMTAAEQGYAPAELIVGACYMQGKGVEQNIEESLKWIRKAADKGDKEACWNLAVVYIAGAYGAKQDYEEGAKYMLRAAEIGHERAHRIMGILYLNGVGVPKSVKFARHWLEKAAAHDDIHAKLLLSIMSSDPEELEKTLEWMKSKVEQGNAEAADFLGDTYRKGELVSRNMEQARIWYEKGAELGSVYSQVKLGYILHYGIGVKQDKVQAMKMYETAMAQGNTEAAIALGKMYYSGDGVPKDKQKGMEIMRRAADLTNNVDALFSMGMMTLENRDFVQAREWFTRAAEQGNVNSMIILGELYRRGIGGDRDLQKAQRLTEEVAARGGYYGVIGAGVGNIEALLDAAETAKESERTDEEH